MLSDMEIYRAAQATIQSYRDGAGLHAAQRADELMAAGDMDGRAVWHRIKCAIDELRWTAPRMNPTPTASLPALNPNGEVARFRGNVGPRQRLI